MTVIWKIRGKIKVVLQYIYTVIYSTRYVLDKSVSVRITFLRTFYFNIFICDFFLLLIVRKDSCLRNQAYNWFPGRFHAFLWAREASRFQA